MTKREILDNVRQLPRAEQVDIAMEVWDLVEIQEAEAPLNATQIGELERRLAQHQQNPSEARPWEQVREEILRELGRP